MNSEKKWTDEEIVKMMSRFVCNVLSLRLLKHEVDEKITSFYNTIKAIDIEYTGNEVESVYNTVEAVAKVASDKSNMFIQEATIYLDVYKIVMNH